MRTQSMTSNSGRPVANQFIIHSDDQAVYFQSYQSMIAKWQNGLLTLGKHWDFSKTTLKYLHMFMNEETTMRGMSAADIRKAMTQGRIMYDPDWS